MLIEDEARAAILAPIEGSVGIDGNQDEGAAGNLLRDIRSRRKALVKLEQALALGGEPPVAEGGWDWGELGEHAITYLAEFGKDLEPMAALVEVSVRESPEDLAAAMALLADLVEAFWDAGLYPAEDEDDGVVARFLPLSGLSGGTNDREGALIPPLRRMTLLTTSGGALRYLDKVRADGLIAAAQTGSGDKTARIEEAEGITRQIEETARGATRAALAAVEAAMTSADADWRRAVAFISSRTKPQRPAASRVSDELEAIRTWLGVLLSRMPADAVPVAADLANDVAPGDSTGQGAVSVGNGGFVAGKITRREDALRAVVLAAEYFGTYEPLSPLGETLREVDRRARLSLYDLLAELIPDESARTNFYWRSGIRPPVVEGS